MTHPETRSSPRPDPDPPPGADPAEPAAAEVASEPEQGWNRVEVITALRAASARQRDAEIDQLALIAAAADVYSWIDNTTEIAAAIAGDNPPKSVLHGERLWRFGADGTPEVAEFLTLEVGPALGMSPESAALLIGDALDLRHRFPRTWKLTLAGRVRVWVARKIARAAGRAELDLATARELDRHIAPFLPGWTPHQTFTRVDMLISQLDPEWAEARRADALRRRYVGIDQAEAGTAQITGQIDGLGGRALDTTLNDLAEVIATGGHDGGHDELRALALETLADPARAAHLLNGTLLSDATDHDHATPATEEAGDTTVGSGSPDTDTTDGACADSTRTAAGAPHGHTGPFGMPYQPRIGVLKLDLRLTAADLCAGAGGHSPQLGEVVRSHLQALIAAAAKVVIQPILDPTAPMAADSYEIPDRIRKAVTALYPTVVFPYSNRSSTGAHVDVDHITVWPDGPTDNGNLAPLDRRTHRGKTFGGYRMRTVHDQVLHWTTPTGQEYWVTPHGTYDYDPQSAPTPSVALAELAREALRRRKTNKSDQRVRDKLGKQTLQPVLIPQPEPPLHWHGDTTPPTPPVKKVEEEPPPF